MFFFLNIRLRPERFGYMYCVNTRAKPFWIFWDQVAQFCPNLVNSLRTLCMCKHSQSYSVSNEMSLSILVYCLKVLSKWGRRKKKHNQFSLLNKTSFFCSRYHSKFCISDSRIENWEKKKKWTQFCSVKRTRFFCSRKHSKFSNSVS